MDEQQVFTPNDTQHTFLVMMCPEKSAGWNLILF